MEYKVTNQIVSYDTKQLTVEAVPGFRLISHSVTAVPTKRYLSVGLLTDDTKIIHSFLWERSND